MKEKIKIGIIGIGSRGESLLKDVILQMRDVDVIIVCDEYEERAEKAKDIVDEIKGNMPACTVNYRDVLKIDELDAVIISSSWESHIPIAIEAMKAGKYVGMEVGGAYSIEDCWQLVKVSEQTGIPCMMLENCCYGRTELMVLNMVKQGVFGEVVHCEGGYHHDLRAEIASGYENKHYRLRNYLSRNCENYPTHELGPIARILDINRGNRMISLNSIASKSAGLHQFILNEKGKEHPFADLKFAQGDIVKTTIKCAQGETITLTLDTTLPVAYSRGFNIRGTKAAYNEENNSIFIDGVHNPHDFDWHSQWGNVKDYMEEYDDLLWKNYLKEGIKGGHDGIDWLVFRAFFESVKNATQTPIDVYDTASWMCISVLSEQSIVCGGAPFAIPDFTNGRWLSRADIK